jgi:hypothetical protein
MGSNLPQTIAAVVILLVIAALVVGLVVRDKRRFRAHHGELVTAWDAAARELGLAWVVPIEHVRAEVKPPALQGRVDGLTLYLAVRDDSVDEELRAKWVIDGHVTLPHEPRGNVKPILKPWKRGRRAKAKVIGRELRVQRGGLALDPDEIVSFARDLLVSAHELERLEITR